MTTRFDPFQPAGPRWYAIEARRPFLEDLAAGVLDWLGDHPPEALSDAVILLPNRRAARAFTAALTRQAGGRAILLPQDPPRYWPVQGESIACQRVLACNNITFAREAALAGAGIVGLPHMICREALQDGRLLELLPQACLPTSEIYALYPSRRFQAMKVKAFLDFLISRLPVEEGPLL